MLRALLVVLLAIEGLMTLLQFTSLVYTIAAYAPLTIAIIIARAVVGIAIATSAWLLATDALPAVAITRAAVAASAVLYIFDAGLALAPSIASPFWRWEFVAAYWIYAAVLLSGLRRSE